MYLIVVLVSLGLLQVWGANNPLHRDEYFIQWITYSKERSWLSRKLYLPLIWCLGLPVFIVASMFLWLPIWLWLIFSVVVLLYSFGRGEFAAYIESYSNACSDERWDDALLEAKEHGVIIDEIEDKNWPKLHELILGNAAYQGFERMFSVLFWFVVFGPAGALLYRLSFIYAQNHPDEASRRWLWAIEWPAVRILGASFAVTGNFVGCINRWKIYILCQTSESIYILRETVLGALSVDDELMQSCDCTQREILALKRLYSRTLWFWLGVIAIFSIIY